MRKKIALICATLATAGLLITGCSKKGDTELRKDMYGMLGKIPGGCEYAIKTEDCTITAEKGDNSLKVKITNKTTGDVLNMTDKGINYSYFGFLPSYGYFSGVDKVTYNGYTNSNEGMDERFDIALRKLKPKLEQKIKEEVYKVKENTKLKY